MKTLLIVSSILFFVIATNAFAKWSVPGHPELDAKFNNAKPKAAPPVGFQRDLNGSQSISNPAQWPAYKLELRQIHDGFAIFADPDRDFKGFVGVEASSLQIIERGVLLRQLQAISNGHVKCLKYLGEEQATSQDGFPAKLVKYTAVECE